MIFTEILRLAFSSLTANKLRSSLTVLGIAVGVFSVIGVMTIINAIYSSIENGVNVLGANSVQISKWPAISFSPNDWQRYRNRRDVTYGVASRFKELMGDSAQVCLTIGRGGQTAIYRDRRTNPNVILIGTDENFVTAYNFDVAQGRNLEADDVAYGRPICVLGSDIAKRLFPDEPALEKLVRINGQNYLVVGVLASKGTSFGQNQDIRILTPLTRFLAVYGRAWRSIGINVQAPNQATMAETQDKAIGCMRIVRGLHPEDPNDFEVFTNQSLIDVFNKIIDVVAVAALIVSSIALVASGVGVMNIMLVSVTERTKEIGIRKSIGAKKRNILLQFLAEAVALSLIGGIAGVLIGVTAGNIMAFAMGMSAVFPWLWTFIGLAVCGGIGVTFGFYPAWKAASLDPIEALRYE
jgi:putative ABC transport system permease protein